MGWGWQKGRHPSWMTLEKIQKHECVCAREITGNNRVKSVKVFNRKTFRHLRSNDIKRATGIIGSMCN